MIEIKMKVDEGDYERALEIATDAHELGCQLVVASQAARASQTPQASQPS